MIHSPSKILIADDEAPNRDLLQALLEPQGYQLSFAVNGAQAIEEAQKVRPDLILLDVMMPGMNGFEACAKLRKTEGLAEMPIVMVTALDDRSSKLKGLEAGADDFLNKPFDRDELTVRVRGITRLNRYRLLTEERQKFEQVIELAPDAILVVDWQAKVRLANLAARQLLCSESSNSIIGHNFIELLGPGEKERLSDPLGELFSGSSNRLLLPSSMVTPGGVVRPVSISARYFPWDSQPAVQLSVRETDIASSIPTGSGQKEAA